MLEQKLKFSDKIEVQQKILSKLRLQQQQSETLAEEAVYEEPFKEQNPFNFDCIDQLPQETEKIIDQFVNQAEFLRTPPTWTGSLLSPPKWEERIISQVLHWHRTHPSYRTSAIMAPTDTGKPAASSPDTGLLSSLHPDTWYPTTSQLPTFTANVHRRPNYLTALCVKSGHL